MVHLTARPVRARISAVGQINQLPGGAAARFALLLLVLQGPAGLAFLAAQRWAQLP